VGKDAKFYACYLDVQKKKVEEEFICIKYLSVVPVDARSKAWVCGRLLAGIAGSNPAGDMDVCLL
jgi:hypothetical protein